jgi:hypothetical protein
MGTLGKILLFVNFIAFGGLMYFATQAWAARQAASANALKHQLAIVGVPLVAPPGIDAGSDGVALGTVVSGFYPVDSVRPKLLEDLFTGTAAEEFAGTPFPRTQVEAVEAAKRKADAKLSGLPPVEQIAVLGGRYTADPATKRVVFTPGWLANMAETYAERAVVRKLADPTVWERQPDKKEANAKTLLAMFERRFEALNKVDAKQADVEAAEVKGATDTVRTANDEAKRKYAAYTALIATPDADPAATTTAATAAAAALDKLNETYAGLQTVLATVGTTASRDEGDRRKRIAHTLMNLAENAGWQKRVALTVGLRTYLAALSDQANRFQKMAGSAEQQVILDQARFADEYDLLKNLAIGQSLLLKSQIAVRGDLQVQRSKDAESVTQRQLLLEDRRATLAASQERVAAQLVAQGETERRLFDVQKAVGDTLRKSFDLEADLAAAEMNK